MTQSSYYQLLRHPQWQKKRLRCMEAAGFSCQDCGTTDRTLNVHHRYYSKGKKPWEYPDHALVTLCDDCHKNRHDLMDEIKVRLGFLEPSHLLQALGYLKGLNFLHDLDYSDASSATIIIGDSDEEALGVAEAYGIPGSYDQIATLSGRTFTGHELCDFRNALLKKSSR